MSGAQILRGSAYGTVQLQVTLLFLLNSLNEHNVSALNVPTRQDLRDLDLCDEGHQIGYMGPSSRMCRRHPVSQKLAFERYIRLAYKYVAMSCVTG